MEDMRHLSNQEKLKLIELKIESPAQPSNDILVDHLFEIKDTDPQIQAFFDDEELIGKLFYESSKRKYAIYQLDQKYKIPDIDRAFREGYISPPRVRQERQNRLGNSGRLLDKQFPRKFLRQR